MIQLQPKYHQKNDWLSIAEKEGMQFEILEFSSAYLNCAIPDDMIRWYAGSGLTNSIHGAFMDNYPLSPDKRIRELSRISCEGSCQLAVKTGAGNVVFHSTALSFLRGPVMLSWCREAAGYYQYLADKYNLNIYMENFSDVDYEPLARMMDEVTDPRVRICLDAGHANYSRVPVSEWLDALDDRIAYLHLSDNDGLWDDHSILGTGNVDLAAVHDWWKKQTKDIPVTLELPTPEATVRSIQYLKTQGFFGFTSASL